MTHDERCSLDHRIQAAIADLESLILQHYPEATFDVSRGFDDPEAIHLNVTADVENLTDLIEVTLDRQMEFQIDDDIPIFVIPDRTPERNRAVMEDLRLRQAETPARLNEQPSQPADTAAS
jgi:hypothetical protein